MHSASSDFEAGIRGLNAEALRLFIAVELPDAVHQFISQVIGEFRQHDLPGIRWVRPDGVHLTLKFLGNVPGSQVVTIAQAMESVVSEVSPFVLHVGSVGVFPHMRAPRVLWVGIQGETEPLKQLHLRLEEALKALGFVKEKRAYSPHLTLGRIKGRLPAPELQRLSDATEQLQGTGSAMLPVAGLSLMESQLTREGAVYRRKAHIYLKNRLAGPSESCYTSPSFVKGK
ncbi:MAG: RNA 2',3'-cyclic phosphodiesterase [Dehalococcoidia bacterium]